MADRHLLALALTIGTIYAALSWSIGVDATQGDHTPQPGLTTQIIDAATEAASSSAFRIGIIVVALALFVLARRGASTGRSLAVGLSIGHTALHTGAIVVTTGASAWLSGLLATELGLGWAPARLLLALVGGSVLGVLAFTVYLLIAQHWKANLNELFSGVRHEGHKGFLRIEVTPAHIRVHAIGLPEVQRRPETGRRVDQVIKRRPSTVLVDVAEIPTGPPRSAPDLAPGAMGEPPEEVDVDIDVSPLVSQRPQRPRVHEVAVGRGS